MKLSSLNIIIALITVTLVGLVTIQFFWIIESLRLKEDLFDRSVNEALSTVTRKLEKGEALRSVVQSVKKRQRRITSSHAPWPPNGGTRTLKSSGLSEDLGAGASGSGDQTADTYTNRLTSKNSRDATQKKGDTSVGTEISISLDHRSVTNAINSISKVFGGVNITFNSSDTSPSRESGSPADLNFRINGRNMDDFINQLSVQTDSSAHSRIKQVVKKSEIVSDVVEELITITEYQSVAARINLGMLEYLLKEELANKSLDIPFEFGIFDYKEECFEMCKAGTDTSHLLNNAYSVKLYPTSIFDLPYTLHVTFPSKKKYLMSGMLSMMLSSALFIFIIAGLFYYTVATIIRQKKMAGIKSDFINNMTHELKTPISIISLASEALQDDDVVKDQNRSAQYLKIINDENKRLGKLVDNVLQSSLLDEGTFRISHEKIEVHPLMDDAVEKIRLQVEQRNGTILKKYEASNSYIYGDVIHLTNVFFNLLDNANKYTVSRPEIVISSQNKNGLLVIEVTDNGIGISNENRTKIFEKFYRVSTGNVHDVKGFGLGLSYVRTVVEKLNGRINVKSEINNGTTIEIQFPSA